MWDLGTLGTVYTPFSSYDAKKENLARLNLKTSNKDIRKGWFTLSKIPELFFARCELVGGNIELEIEFLKTDSIGCQKWILLLLSHPNGFWSPAIPIKICGPELWCAGRTSNWKGLHSRVFFPGLTKEAMSTVNTFVKVVFVWKGLVVW